jgi:AraC-like DNA-binding protein
MRRSSCPPPPSSCIPCYSFHYPEYTQKVIQKTKLIRYKNTQFRGLNTDIEIAFEVGFNSKASFNNHFLQMTGQTPSEYRKAMP